MGSIGSNAQLEVPSLITALRGNPRNVVNVLFISADSYRQSVFWKVVR